MSGKTVLSARMQAVADMVTAGGRVCDVGCDHGFISIYLVQEKIAPAVLAMDVRKGPLERAREHVEQAGLGDYIELRLSDGLSSYQPGEARSLILAGMGGPLIWRILSREEAKTRDFSELILQPQSEVAQLRGLLRKAGYVISRENMVREEGKFYPVIKALPKESAEAPGEAAGLPEELADRFGALLLLERHPVLQEYLRQQENELCKLILQLRQAKGERAFARIKELERELTYLRQAAKL